MIRKILAASAMMPLVLTPACAEGAKTAPMDKAEIEAIVHDYILAHPEVVEEALYALQARDAKQAADARKAAIAQNSDELYKNPSDPSIGPEDAPITLVEFFDYRCGYCKRTVDYVQGLPAEYDGKVRVVFKEYPIFGGISEDAALAGLAARKQGKYRQFHIALMKVKSNDDLTQEKIDSVAKSVGMDTAKMRADMKSVDLQKQLADVKALGRALDVGGTPGFFLGDTHIEGADQDGIEAAIREALG